MDMVIFFKKKIWTHQFLNSSTDMADLCIIQKAIFLWLLGSEEYQKIERLGIPCTGNSVELFKNWLNFLPTLKNGHRQLKKLDFWHSKPHWNPCWHLPGTLRHISLPLMVTESSYIQKLFDENWNLWNFDIFWLFSGTLGLILFCFPETRKTLLSLKRQAPFESSRTTGPWRSLQKPYNSLIKELHLNH